MYHWTETRILGHLSLCYICFTLLNYLQLQLNKQKTPQSENQIRKNLINMQMSLTLMILIEVIENNLNNAL